MRLVYSAFQGERPILDARLLPENAAQTAENVYLRHGTLQPEQDTASQSVTTVSDPTTLYRYPHGNNGDGFWLSWSGDPVHVVPSPLADDDHERLYWTGDGVPRMAAIDHLTSGTAPYPGASYELGIPAPDSAPSVSAPADRVAEGEWPDTALETAYVVTLVSGYGEEGPPSDPSGTITRWDMVSGAPDGGEVEVSLPGIVSGNHDLVTQRLYRVESGGIYQFVADLDAAATSYTDAVTSDSLGAALPSVDWDAPDPRLVGLTALPGGILAGFFDNTLCFCEAYRPHAWPVGYQLAFPYHIVAIASVANGLVVVTDGHPYMVTGSSPEAMAPTELEVPLPCVSAASLVDMGDYALYASPDGLVAVGGREARLVTREIMSRDQWRALDPSTIHAYRYDERYLAFYDGGSFAFSPEDGIEFFTIEADAGYYDLADDTLYLVQGGSVTAWGQGSDLTYIWRSRIEEVVPGTSFTCAKVIAADYPVTLRLYADGNTVIDREVDSHDLFRLPAGYAFARDWEVEVEGTNEVNSVQIASSPQELV
ncbi:hypothetical protein [Halomonas sp. NO4]|uniref:hypothetical protein n=1 Tax=Halomonas sp. NO4 TaxID=2484813 RepID=UPI0013D0529F|nr:hypothetical protein [Halomonas sp. NO4]